MAGHCGPPAWASSNLNSGAEIVPSARQLIDREASYVQAKPVAIAILALAAMVESPFLADFSNFLANIFLDLTLYAAM